MKCSHPHCDCGIQGCGLPPPKEEPERFVPHELRSKAALYDERNKIYGDNYKLFGSVMRSMFPAGVFLESEDDFNRFGVFVQIIAKQTRYAANFMRGGHDDSLDDTSVYSMMLKELDAEARGRK